MTRTSSSAAAVRSNLRHKSEHTMTATANTASTPGIVVSTPLVAGGPGLNHVEGAVASTPLTTQRRAARGTRRSPRRAAVIAAIAVAVGGAGIAGQAVADSGTMKVSGSVETLLGPGPDCAAPTGLCFPGEIRGSLTGPVEGEVNSFTPTQQPGVSLADASVTIHTKHGDLYIAHEQVVYNTDPAGKGEFAWQMQITSGTGRYAGATGYLQGTGHADPTSGVSEATYAGEITPG